MRLIIYDKENIIIDILEAENMFRKNGSFRSHFRRVFTEQVLKGGGSVVFSPTNDVTHGKELKKKFDYNYAKGLINTDDNMIGAVKFLRSKGYGGLKECLEIAKQLRSGAL